MARPLLAAATLIHLACAAPRTAFAPGAREAAPSLPRRTHGPRSAASSSSSSSDDATTAEDASSSSSAAPLPRLNVAIVGAGPSGLLLAHRLLSSSAVAATVAVYESRPDSRRHDGLALAPADEDLASTTTSGSGSSSRAYALGLGPRARRAIRSAGAGLWDEVEARGCRCDRFTLHVTPRIKLRLRDGGGQGGGPPSVLIYQTDLCAALADGLEERYGGGDNANGGRVQIHFDARVVEADVRGGLLTIQNTTAAAAAAAGGETAVVGPFDLVAGCGGVRSPVREGISRAAPPGTFRAETRDLPGSFKVARLPSMPPLLDPASVALVLPSKPKADATKKKKNKEDGGGGGGDGAALRRPQMSSGSISAFVEPVAGGGACILFAGRGGGDSSDASRSDGASAAAATERAEETLLSDWRLERYDQDDVRAFSEDIVARFPLLEGTPERDLASMVRQLLSQRPGVAAAVKCNAFHFGRAALCGDAAHATGGVSGQGVNSALVDSAVLAECIDAQFAGAGGSSGGEDVQKTLGAALLAYSQKQVPEGLALYDLSFGPEGELGLLGRLRALLSTIRDTLFGGRFGVGKPLLQVQLSQSTRSFSDIRRERDAYYGVAFPNDEEFRQKLATLYDV
jgi:kynurenine 3-monooxygenase